MLLLRRRRCMSHGRGCSSLVLLIVDSEHLRSLPRLGLTRSPAALGRRSSAWTEGVHKRAGAGGCCGGRHAHRAARIEELHSGRARCNRLDRRGDGAQLIQIKPVLRQCGSNVGMKMLLQMRLTRVIAVQQISRNASQEVAVRFAKLETNKESKEKDRER